VSVKKAKTNEETAESISVSLQKSAHHKKPMAPPQQPAPASAATSSKEKYLNKDSKKRPNPTDDEGTVPDVPKTPVPPQKKQRGKNSNITRKPQPLRRTGIAL